MIRLLIGSLIIFVLCGVFFSLGLWQLDRAEQKRALAERIENTTGDERLVVSGRIDTPADLLLSRVQVTGEFVEPVIILDSKKHQGKLGYQVVFPMRLAGTQQHMLINLGWQAGKAETALSSIKMPTGQQVLEGQIGTAEKGFRPGFDRPGDQQGGIWIYLDPDYLATNQGYDVLPLVMRLETDLQDGLVRDWPVIEPDPGMHIGYAIQWFSFAGVLVVFYGWRVWVYFKKRT